jgi:tetratricopeptide (TPR) repeat protein
VGTSRRNAKRQATVRRLRLNYRTAAVFWRVASRKASATGLDRAYRANLERRLTALEKRLEAEPENPEVLRAMGLMAFLEDQFERANALFERAHRTVQGRRFRDDSQFRYRFGAGRQVAARLTLLETAQQKWPASPLVLFNLALVALHARRAQRVHEVVAELEKLWLGNEALAQEFHDEAVTLDGLAFLLENKPREALAKLSTARRESETAPNVDEREKVDQRDLNRAERRQQQREIEGEDRRTSNNDRRRAGRAREDAVGETARDGFADANALNNLALAEAETGNTEGAVAHLQAALRLEPGHPQVLNNLGVLAYRQNRLDVAQKYLESTRQIEEFLGSVEATTWNHLGVVQSARGDLEGSLQSFQHAGSLEHAQYEVFLNVGRAFIEHAKPDVGVNYLRQAFTLEPNSADVHAVLGAAYLFSGKLNFYGEALKHLKRAIQIDSHHRTAAVNLVLVLQEIRNNEAARGLVAQALKLFPGEPEPHFLAALMALEVLGTGPNDERFWAGAATQFDMARTARPDLVSAIYNSALCQFMMGFRDTSAQLLEAVVARDGSLGPAYYLIGYGHAVAKRENEALAAWKVAVGLEPNNPDLHANVASLLYRRGDFQGAIRSYMNAHRLLPQDPIFWRRSELPSRRRRCSSKR